MPGPATPQSLANIAWAFAKLACEHGPLFEAIASAALATCSDFECQGLANTAWAYSALVVRHGPLLDALASAAQARLEELSQQNLANIAWAYAMLEVCDAPLLLAISSQARPRCGQFSPQGLANLAWAFSRLLLHDLPLIDSLSSAVLRKLSLFAPQNLVNTLWSIARLVYGDAPLFAAIAAESLRRIADYDPQHLSSTAWSCAAFQYEDIPFMQALSAAVIARVRRSKPQDLANTAWSVAKLGLLHRPLLEAISAQSIGTIAAFEQQNVANMAWAFATLGVANVPLLAAISVQALRTVREWPPQSLSNTAWAFASLELLHRTLLDAIAAAAIPKIAEFKPQELMNLAWAFATFCISNQPLLQALSAAAIAKIREFNPHDLSGMVWAFSVLGFRDKQLLDAISAEALATLAEFKPQDLANTAWSFANLRVCDEPLLHAISAPAIARIGDFQPQDLSNTFWAFAKLELPPGELLIDAISSAVLESISELEPQNLAMTAWAFATLGIVDEPLMAAIAAQSLRRLRAFATHDLANLLWSYSALELEVRCLLFQHARRILVDRVPREAAAVATKLDGKGVSQAMVAEVSEFTNSLLEFAWSFAFSEQEMGDLAAVLRSGLMVLARALDEGCSADSLCGTGAYGMGPKWGAAPRPSVVLDLDGIVVLLKPPHWEVDARAGGSPVPAPDIGAPLLSSFLRWTYPAEQYPLVHCNEQQFGIIHRLDTPSSGLILAGKSFVGYYTLRWQQDTYELGREYLVLCKGRMPWGSRAINAKIKTSKTEPLLSRVSDDGKPAWTLVDPLCILAREGGQEFSLVAIMIRTGRTHQIRVHLKHIGHPTVTDGKYTDQATFQSDKVWCPRNFLHRHRLTFQDTTATLREAVAQLPEDLLAVLRAMCPAPDGRSPEVLRKVLAGWVPNAGLV